MMSQSWSPLAEIILSNSAASPTALPAGLHVEDPSQRWLTRAPLTELECRCLLEKRVTLSAEPNHSESCQGQNEFGLKLAMNSLDQKTCFRNVHRHVLLCCLAVVTQVVYVFETSLSPTSVTSSEVLCLASHIHIRLFSSHSTAGKREMVSNRHLLSAIKMD